MKKNGFTLMELMVTVAIVGLLAALAGPQLYSAIQGGKVKSAIAELRGDLQKAKMRAIKENQEYKIKFNADNYQLKDSANNIKETVTLTAPITYQWVAATRPVGDEVGFNSQGMIPTAYFPGGGNDIEIRLKNDYRTYGITCSPAGSIKTF